MTEHRGHRTRDGHKPPAIDNWQLPKGGTRKELERARKCCANCIYSTRPCGRWFRIILSRFLGLLTCANSAEMPGKVKGVAPCNVCANFRARSCPLVRVEPPTPPNDLVCHIGLTQGLFATVDAADYERLRAYKWHALRRKGRFYACRTVNGRHVMMHRVILPPPPGMVVDHIDGNGLNNCRANLRICTPAQNACNRGKNRTCANEFKGVWPDKKSGKYHAAVSHKGETFYLSTFATALEAARAYDRKAIEMHGRYAHVNLPDEWPPERREAVMEEARIRALAQKRPEGV